MRKKFPGYYHPTDDEFSKLWEECVFVLDANVLLNLYRYTPETRDELLGILKDYSDRLWLPYQAALEYHQNRLTVIQQLSESYSSMQKLLTDSQNKIETDLQSLVGRGRHPFVTSSNLMDKIKTTFMELQKQLKELEMMHPNLIDNDPILETITDLFEGKVGSSYSAEQLGKIYKDGRNRYENKLPPGYRDANKNGAEQYGDLVLWFQIIDYAKDTKRSIILVTDDRKDDWWLKIKGQIKGPNPELVHEIISEAGVSFYMYSADPFMERTREYLNRQIKQQAIEEIREIRHSDEKRLFLLSTALTNVALRAVISNDTWASLREAITIPDDTLKSMRAAMTAMAVPDDTLKSMRAAMTAMVAPDNTLKSMRAMITALTLPNDMLASLRTMSEIVGLNERSALMGTASNIRDTIVAIEKLENKDVEQGSTEEDFGQSEDLDGEA